MESPVVQRRTAGSWRSGLQDKCVLWHMCGHELYWKQCRPRSKAWTVLNCFQILNTNCIQNCVDSVQNKLHHNELRPNFIRDDEQGQINSHLALFTYWRKGSGMYQVIPGGKERVSMYHTEQWYPMWTGQSLIRLELHFNRRQKHHRLQEDIKVNGTTLL